MNRELVAPYGFLAPKTLLFTIFIAGPLIAVFWMSLYNWSLLGGHRFIGFSNYTEMFGDREFWRALQNTVVISSVLVPVSLLGGFLLAVTLNRPQPGRRFFRLVLYLPDVISGVAAATISAWIFNDQYGVLNAALNYFSAPRLPWLSSPVLAMPAVITASIWMRTGFCMVVYLAALQDIPAEVYEAAHLDGADGWQQIRYVTWPLVRQTTIFLFITNVIYSFHVFDLVYVMTGGGPAFSTTVLVQYLYDAGFDMQREGYACAISVALYLLISLVTILMWLVTRNRQKA
jgi:multiple sugar transport system permease protein